MINNKKMKMNIIKIKTKSPVKKRKSKSPVKKKSKSPVKKRSKTNVKKRKTKTNVKKRKNKSNVKKRTIVDGVVGGVIESFNDFEYLVCDMCAKFITPAEETEEVVQKGNIQYKKHQTESNIYWQFNYECSYLNHLQNIENNNITYNTISPDVLRDISYVHGVCDVCFNKPEFDIDNIQCKINTTQQEYLENKKLIFENKLLEHGFVFGDEETTILDILDALADWQNTDEAIVTDHCWSLLCHFSNY